MTEEKFCARIPLKEICDFQDNVVVVVVVIVVVVNRSFLPNYVALRNLLYVKFKNLLVLPIKSKPFYYSANAVVYTSRYVKCIVVWRTVFFFNLDVSWLCSLKQLFLRFMQNHPHTLGLCVPNVWLFRQQLWVPGEFDKIIHSAGSKCTGRRCANSDSVKELIDTTAGGHNETCGTANPSNCITDHKVRMCRCALRSV
jgi:hypothetical protein